MPLVPSSFPSWFRWTAAPWVWSAAAVPTTSGLRPRSGRFVWSAAASRFRPAATSPAARPGPRWSKQAPPLHALHPSL